MSATYFRDFFAAEAWDPPTRVVSSSGRAGGGGFNSRCRIKHRLIHNMVHTAMTTGVAVRTTLNLDEGLLNEAQRLTGIDGRTALVKESLRALIERESARRLARLGGSEPQLKPIPRRRPASG